MHWVGVIRVIRVITVITGIDPLEGTGALWWVLCVCGVVGGRRVFWWDVFVFDFGISFV